jgi:hypothetical protein
MGGKLMGPGQDGAFCLKQKKCFGARAFSKKLAQLSFSQFLLCRKDQARTFGLGSDHYIITCF